METEAVCSMESEVYQTMTTEEKMDFRRKLNENVRVEQTVEFEKGIKTTIIVSENDFRYGKDTLFGISDMGLHNMRNASEYPAITVWGGFRKPFEHLALDPVSGLERPLYFVFGDVLVPAECVGNLDYRGLLLPNLPGEVDFFVSINGMTPVSPVVKLTFPSTKKSKIRTELEEKLVKLLVTSESDQKKLMRKLRKCDNKNTHSERVFRDYLKDWLFDTCKTINIIDRRGLQVIHLFAGLGYAWAICFFKRFGFSLDSRDENGWTPMHWAAYYGRKGVTTALIIGRADPTLLTIPTSDYPYARTAADIAFEQHHYHLYAYLAEFIEHPEKREETIFAHPRKQC